MTTEVARAPASDGLFPAPFAWTDRRGNAWFGIVTAAAAAVAAHAVGLHHQDRPHSVHLPG